MVTMQKKTSVLSIYLYMYLWLCAYLCIAVVLKLLSDKGVKSIPVRTGQVATYCPKVAKYEGLA